MINTPQLIIKSARMVSRTKSKRLGMDLDQPVSRFTQPPVMVYADDAVRDAAKLMRNKQVGSVIVAEKKKAGVKEPMGILTEWDLLDRVIAEGRDVKHTRVREVMSAPLQRIDANDRVGDALRMMINRGIRRLAVMEDGVLVGTVTQTQIIGNRRMRSSRLPIVESIRGHTCPYCNSSFGTQGRLSAHIDSTHGETLRLKIEEEEELKAE